MPKKTIPVKSRIHVSAFLILMAVAIGTLGIQVAFNGKVAPNTVLADSLIEFENGAEVQEKYSQQLDAFEAQPMMLTYQDQTLSFMLNDLGVVLDKTASVQTIPVISPSSSPWSFEGGLFGEKEVSAQFSIEEEKLITSLNQAFSGLDHPAHNAQLEWNSRTNSFEILPEEAGWHLDKVALLDQMKEKIKSLKPLVFTLAITPEVPQIIEADLEMSRPELEEKIKNVLTLSAEGATWEVTWSEFLGSFIFEPQKTIQVDGALITLDKTVVDMPTQTTLKIQLNPDGFTSFIEDQLVPDLEVVSADVTITQNEEGEILFEGTATDGIQINQSKLIKLLELALNRNIATVEIPLIKTPGRVTVTQALRERGITELVTTGYSGYFGSPYNRQHNIKTAIARFNGALVEPGATFSFGEILGEVDGSTGYVKELVIREGETIPEYGGGVCQVSSTLFRAILFSGLAIVERHPHSYAVSYYAFPLGYGLDATVYPPQVDLKFLNDMKTPILIQAYQDGFEAYFKFYGTKDGREVAMEGPYISNRQSPPPPIYIETTDLDPGQKKKADSAHSGFTAEWGRTVTYLDGKTTTDTIISPYTPWAEKWQVGVEKE